MYKYRLLTPTESFEIPVLQYINGEEIEKIFKKTEGDYLTDPIQMSGKRIEIEDDAVYIETSEISRHTFSMSHDPDLTIKEVQFSPSTEPGFDFDVSILIGERQIRFD